MEICQILFGADLYGCVTPNSDKDYKSIQLPTWEEVCLGKIPKQYANKSTGNNETKNTKDDIDIEIFSLHEFVKLALEGQTVAFDMMHAPPDKTLITSQIWKDLVANRDRFYSKNISAMLGYVQTQCKKYGIVGSRLNDAKAVLDWLEGTISFDKNAKLLDCNLSTFPTGEHIIWYTQSENGLVALQGTDMVEVCNRKILLNSKLTYAYDMIKKFYDNYGDRARQAANSENVDWKACHHAARVALQTIELFRNNTITFPRPEAKLLLQIKTGQWRYPRFAEYLEVLVNKVQELHSKSILPENPDKAFWNNWLIKVIEENCVPVKEDIPKINRGWRNVI